MLVYKSLINELINRKQLAHNNNNPSESNSPTPSQPENDIANYIALCINKKATIPDLQKLCESTMHYCIKTKYPHVQTETPKLIFKEIEDDNYFGVYDSNTNTITINLNYLKKIQDDPFKILNLIDTMAHETRHFEQRSATDFYNNLSDEEKKKISQQVKQTLHEYNTYFYLNASQLKLMKDLFLPKEKTQPFNETVKHFNNGENFWNDMAMDSYLFNKVEKEARESGHEFAKDIIDMLTIKYRSNSELTNSLQEIANVYNSNHAETESIYNSNEKVYDWFISNFTLNEQQILDTVKDVDTSKQNDNNIDMLDFGRVLWFITQTYPIDKKISLLEKAMDQNCDSLTSVLIESCQVDINYQQNKERIDSLIDILNDNSELTTC